jgi:hypothetical protein
MELIRSAKMHSHLGEEITKGTANLDKKTEKYNVNW